MASELVLKDYEMLKAFPGITTHEAVVAHPHLRELAEHRSTGTRSRQPAADRAPVPAYLIRGHGAYGWGKDMEEAERVIEALEHLLSCEIEAIRLQAGVRA